MTQRQALSLISYRHGSSTVYQVFQTLEAICQTHDITVDVIGSYLLITNLRCV